jgi:hypothetical protein
VVTKRTQRDQCHLGYASHISIALLSVAIGSCPGAGLYS